MSTLGRECYTSQRFDSSSVQPRETTLHSALPGSYQAFLNRDHPAEFFAAEQSYKAIDERDNSDKLGLLHSCRTDTWFVRDPDTDKLKIATNSCRLRGCSNCAKARQQFITMQILPWFRWARGPKLLTLTTRHTSAPLLDQVVYLYKCYRKLMRKKVIAKRVRGTVKFLQVTHNNKTSEWHPHLHVLLDADYIEHKLLKKYWAEITGGSTIVHIKCVKDTDKTVKHHARYAAGPSTLVDLPEDKRIELLDMFKNRRLVSCTGTARCISLRPQKPADADSCVRVGSWWLVTNLAGQHSVADEILFAWRTDTPLAKESTLYELEHEVQERSPPEDRPRGMSQNWFGFYTNPAY